MYLKVHPDIERPETRPMYSFKNLNVTLNSALIIKRVLQDAISRDVIVAEWDMKKEREFRFEWLELFHIFCNYAYSKLNCYKNALFTEIVESVTA